MHGHIWSTGGLVIESVEVEPPTRLVKHVHDAPQLAFLEYGEIEGRFGGRDRTVEARTLRLSPAGDAIDLTFTAPSRCIVIQLAERLCGVPLPAIEDRKFDRTARISALATELSRTLQNRLPSPLSLECLVLELWAETSESPNHRRFGPPDWLVRVRDRLRSEPASPPSTLELAEEAGYHPVYVARMFRRCFGIGLGEYARVARAEYARSLLQSSDLELADVAFQAGYADQSHLSRSMRRFLDATPRALRLSRTPHVQVSSFQDLHPDGE